MSNGRIDRHLTQQWANRQRFAGLVPIQRTVDNFRKGVARNQVDKLARIKHMWGQVFTDLGLGKELLGQCFPISLRGGILSVSVDSTSACFELAQFHGERILKQLQAVRPGLAVRNMRFILRSRA